MKLRARIVSVVVVSAVAATFICYRFRLNGVTRSSSTETNAHWLADSAWMKQRPDALPAPKLRKAIPSARLAQADRASLFATSTDLFAFAKEAAGPAFRGDGTAALYLARALKICQLQVVLYGHTADPQSAFENSLSQVPYEPESEIAKLRQNFARCKSFFSGDAFASLPPKKGGYLSFPYWENAAIKDGNPVAQVIQVATELPAIGNSPNRQVTMKAQASLSSAVATGDPEAVFRTGLILMNGHGGNSIDAYALTLAGCDLGYDCSADNPLIFGDCAMLGTCATGSEFQDLVSKQLGQAGYAKAYGVAQQIEAAISQGDTNAIAGFVNLSK